MKILLIIPLISFSVLALTPLIIFIILFFAFRALFKSIFIRNEKKVKVSYKKISETIKMPSLPC